MYEGRTQEEWVIEYQRRQALWFHDGNPKRPHALLTSGNHSSGFFNSRPVIEDEKLLREVAFDLVDKFVLGGLNFLSIPARVVGPKTGATKLAEFLSDEIGRRRRRPCTWASPMKSGEGEAKRMIFEEPEQSFMLGEDVLLCEDVITTGGSTELVHDAVKECGGSVMSLVLVIVNRSGLRNVGSKAIQALITQPMPIWTPQECPLCKEESEAIRPKGENWARLIAAY